MSLLKFCHKLLVKGILKHTYILLNVPLRCNSYTCIPPLFFLSPKTINQPPMYLVHIFARNTLSRQHYGDSGRFRTYTFCLAYIYMP